jgi:predicted RNA binding protein YcfA (HicA-like mRNA interferase family)
MADPSSPYSRPDLAKLPRVSGAQAIRALEKLGFVQVRQRGSHVVLKRTDASGPRGCVIPLHTELASGTLRGILKQAAISIEQFVEKI